MEINTYTDYLVERLEIASVGMVFVTIACLAVFGFVWAIIPPLVFHIGAYWGWRRFKKSATIQPVLQEDYIAVDTGTRRGADRNRSAYREGR